MRIGVGGQLGPLAPVAVPAGAVIGRVVGGIAGVACGLASIQYAHAPGDFQDILARVDRDFFRQATQKHLVNTKPICVQGVATDSRDIGADTILEINKISVGMACGSGRQQITAAVDWQATSAISGRLIGQKTSVCRRTFPKAFDAWFADKQQAQKDIEAVLSRTAEQVTRNLYYSENAAPCAAF